MSHVLTGTLIALDYFKPLIHSAHFTGSKSAVYLMKIECNYNRVDMRQWCGSYRDRLQRQRFRVQFPLTHIQRAEWRRFLDASPLPKLRVAKRFPKGA